MKLRFHLFYVDHFSLFFGFDTYLSLLHLFVDMNDLQEHIKVTHRNQKLQCRFDLQVGLSLRNIRAGELRSYYPSLNKYIILL